MDEQGQRELDQWIISAAEEEVSARDVALYTAGVRKRIRAARDRAKNAATSPLVRHFLTTETMAGEPVRYEITDEVVAGERWEGMTIPARRELIRSVLAVVIVPGTKGVKLPIRERIQVTVA